MRRWSFWFLPHTYIVCLVLGGGAVAVPAVSWAQSGSTLPVAQTIELAGGATPPPGQVVRYDEARDEYRLTTRRGDEAVYGVVAERPALVFVTASSAAAVVTGGTTEVAVTVDETPIARGDLLVSATGTGVATRATLADSGVFAVALEPATQAGSVLAEVGVERAQAVQAARREAQAAAAKGSGPDLVATGRIILAATVALGALGFLLYSFRSIMTGGITSIGRNPRARGTVMLVSVGSMVLAVVVVGFVVFVAVGILVLPV